MIRIKNIYYLLIYAWNVLEEASEVEVHATDSTKLVDLFAQLLHDRTEKLLRRGLDRGYREIREELPGVKGKLNFAESLKRLTFPNGRAVCDFEELSHDVLHNRIIRSTIRRLLQVRDLSPDLRERLDTTLYRLHQVSEVELTSRTFRSVQLHRNNRSYRFLLALCRLIHNAGLLTEDAGESQFVDFIRDEKRMRKLFERFVWNFFYREQRQLRPVGNKLDWAGLRGDQESLNLMPGMRTDVRLVSKTRCVVIETKYVPQMLQAYHGKESLRSQHLYQLHTYLSNVVPLGNRRVEGILLYPAVGRKLDVRVELDRFPIRAFALDLDQDWQAIRADLLSLVGTQAPRVSAGRDASLERAEASKKGSYRWPP